VFNQKGFGEVLCATIDSQMEYKPSTVRKILRPPWRLSTDRIGIPTLRMAALMVRLRGCGENLKTAQMSGCQKNKPFRFNYLESKPLTVSGLGTSATDS
jgi:hypothetical protein